MPSIQLTNNTTINITASSADDDATLNRYLKNPLVFLTPGGFDAIANKPVGSLKSAAFPITVTAGGEGQFAVKGSTLDVQLGATASLGLLAGDDKADFFSALQLTDDPAVAALVSFEFQGTLAAGPSVTVGDFSFGITKGATVSLTNVCPAAATEKFGDAVKRAIAGLTIPHDIDDLRSLPANAICEVDGASSLQFAASLTYNFLNDPLATISIPKLPAITVNASAGATLEATATHTADHTVTIAKLPNGRIHLAVSLTKTDDFEISLTVSAGLTGGVGGFDAIAFMLDKISPNGGEEIKKIGKDLPPDQVKQLSSDIKTALESALSSSLQVSLKAALDKSKSENRLFLYEIDLNALDETSTAAVQSALTGNFVELTRLDAILAGVQRLESALTITSQTTHSVTLHLLGIFNWGSTSSFIENSKIDYTKDTHEIVFSDEKIQIVTNNLHSEKLREVVLKGITLTIPASANTPDAATPIQSVFFERKAKASSSTMRQFVNALQATGAASVTRAASLLTRNLSNYGTSSLYLGLNLNPSQCRKLFIDAAGDSYDWTYYLKYACDAQNVILNGDEDAIREGRLKLFSAGTEFWKKLRDAGSRQNQVALLATRGIGPTADVDVITFIWWSSAMADYSKALAANQSLEEVGRKIVRDATSGFNEPWLILAFWEMLQKPTVNSLFTSSLLELAAGSAP